MLTSYPHLQSDFPSSGTMQTNPLTKDQAQAMRKVLATKPNIASLAEALKRYGIQNSELDKAIKMGSAEELIVSLCTQFNIFIPL